MTLYVIGFLVGGALVGVLVGAVVAGVLRQRMRYWVTGGLAVGLAVGFVGLSDRSGPERDAQLFYDDCLKGTRGSAADSVNGAETYCSCLAGRLKTNEGGFRTAIEGLSDEVTGDVDEATAAAVLTNDVVQEAIHACFEPVIVDVCSAASGKLGGDADPFCRCAVDALKAHEGGMTWVGQKLAEHPNPQAFMGDTEVLETVAACE